MTKTVELPIGLLWRCLKLFRKQCSESSRPSEIATLNRKIAKLETLLASPDLIRFVSEEEYKACEDKLAFPMPELRAAHKGKVPTRLLILAMEKSAPACPKELKS